MTLLDTPPQAEPTTGFLTEYDAIAQSGLAPTQIAKLQVGLVMQWVLGRSAELFAELRASRPILVTAGPVLVARYDDVTQVAEREAFTVRPYGASMRRYNGGSNFLLGMDDRTEHANDRAALQEAIRRSDMGALRASSAREAASVIARARASGRLDVTDAYARSVSARVMNRYYYGERGPDAAGVMGWSRDMYRDIFFNFAGDPRISEAGMAAAGEFRTLLDGLIADFGAGGETVLGRLLSSGALSADRIRDNLVGCTVGVVDNVGNAFVNALDHLLGAPEHLRAAAMAVDDDALVLRYLLEALRFHPAASILVRYTAAEVTLGDVAIPANRLVLASTASAMLDERVVRQPAAFDLARPLEHYLHFGWGMHECFGRHIAQVQLAELLKAVLRLPNLRRADGVDGTLRYTDGFPRPLVVAFDPV